MSLTKEFFPMLRLALLFLSLGCFTSTALAAEGPAGDVFGGFSVNHTASDNSAVTFTGWQVNAAFDIHKVIGVVTDFAGEYKRDEDGQLQYLFGPRFSGQKKRLIYFGEALFGGDHIAGETFFAMGYGGGIEVQAGKIRIRLLQIDWIPVRRGNGEPWVKNNMRYGFGVDIPFGKTK
jgi:hypothetical protein